jgi:tripartite-type tricarboxylate transporter receptor subunit TctC
VSILTRVAFGGFFSVFLTFAPAFAQDFPSRPLHIFNSQPPGTSVDSSIRFYANRMTALTGQQMNVENKTGAGGAIAARSAIQSKPDGYTMFLGTTASQAANPHLYKNLAYDPVKDLSPVTPLFRLPFVLAVNPEKTPVNTVAELTAFLKKKGGPSVYGWATASMLASGELYKSLAGVTAEPVPYRGTTQQMGELQSGALDFVFTDLGIVLNSKGMRPLAVTTAERTSLKPELPTMIEAGFPRFQHIFSWFAIYVPAGTPQPAIDRLSQLFNQITAMPETKAFLANIAGEPMPGTPKSLADFQASETRRWADLVKIAKIEPQ